MSDNWLQYIPIDPQFKPTMLAATEAKTMLSSFTPLAEAVRFEFPSSVSFYHPGANWLGVECPICGADAEPWWSDAMGESGETQFHSLVVTAACCGAKVSLNELRYLWPAGFGSFIIEAMNPNINGLSSQQLGQLAHVLGCSLREIAVHL